VCVLFLLCSLYHFRRPLVWSTLDDHPPARCVFVVAFCCFVFAFLSILYISSCPHFGAKGAPGVWVCFEETSRSYTSRRRTGSLSLTLIVVAVAVASAMQHHRKITTTTSIPVKYEGPVYTYFMQQVQYYRSPLSASLFLFCCLSVGQSFRFITSGLFPFSCLCFFRCFLP